MKIFLLIFMMIFLAAFIFFRSDTLEVSTEKEYKGDVEYFITRYSMHWDRFFEYLKNIPQKLFAAAEGIKGNFIK